MSAGMLPHSTSIRITVRKNNPVEVKSLDGVIFFALFTGLSMSYTNKEDSPRINIVRGSDKFSPILHNPTTQFTSGHGNM